MRFYTKDLNRTARKIAEIVTPHVGSTSWPHSVNIRISKAAYKWLYNPYHSTTFPYRDVERMVNEHTEEKYHLGIGTEKEYDQYYLRVNWHELPEE